MISFSAFFLNGTPLYREIVSLIKMKSEFKKYRNCCAYGGRQNSNVFSDWKTQQTAARRCADVFCKTIGVANRKPPFLAPPLVQVTRIPGCTEWRAAWHNQYPDSRASWTKPAFPRSTTAASGRPGQVLEEREGVSVVRTHPRTYNKLGTL